MLVDFPPTVFWIHQKQLVSYLCLLTGPYTGPEGDALTIILECTKNSFGGNTRIHTKVLSGLKAVDLFDSQNNLHICCQEFGSKEDLLGGTLSNVSIMRYLRWFSFRNNRVIEVKEQVQIVNELTGSMPLDETGISVDDVIPRKTSRRRHDLHWHFHREEKEWGL